MCCEYNIFLVICYQIIVNHVIVVMVRDALVINNWDIHSTHFELYV